MRKVLLVTNRRPDDAGGRAEKFDARKRLLRDHGWEVVVGYVPEPYLRSFLPSVRRLVRLARREDVVVVNSVNNPFHLHLIGYLVSQLSGTRWLAELRDPIYTHPDRSGLSPVTYAAAAIERLVVHAADGIVWFDGIQLPDDYFETRYPDAVDRIAQLPFMGYERGKFEDAASESREPFTITYAGSFYDGWIEPYDFLAGFGQFMRGQPDAEIEAHFYGDWDPAYTAAAREAGVEDRLVTHDPIPHDELVPVLKGSDVLLYVGGDDPGNELNVPSKTWDYIGARSPILSIVDPEFRVARFIREQGLGIVVPTDDSEAVADAIESLYTGTADYDPDPSVFDRYTRERTAQRFAEALDSTAAGEPLSDR